MQIKNTHPKRSIIVNSKDVTKGGELTHDSDYGTPGMLYINPGDTVEIDDVIGQKIANDYGDIMVIEKPKAMKKKV